MNQTNACRKPLQTPMVSDEELVMRTIAGDIDAFNLLVQRYQHAAYGLAFHLVKNFADAQDLTQDAFIAAYQNLPTIKEPAKFASWLRGITANLCKMWLRKRREVVSLDEVQDNGKIGLIGQQSVLTPPEEIERQELRESVMRAVNSLSEKNRLVVTLYYIDGMSYREIANFLDVPVTTVEGRLHRAKKKLQKEMVNMIKEVFAEEKVEPEETELPMKAMLSAGLHFGHSVDRANPKMAEYILTARKGIGDANCEIHIFDLTKTRQKLKEAIAFVRKITNNGKQVLFVGTKKQAQPIIAEQAQRCSMPYLNEPNPDGCGAPSGQITAITTESGLGAVLIIDVRAEHEVVVEARNLGIPIIALVDTNSDPDDVDIVIPGNDDAVRSIDFVCNQIADAVLTGVQ